MATSDKIAALQCYYLNQNNDIFWIILRLGGCIMQQQLCRLLNNNLTDTTKNTALVKKLEEAQLIKIKKIGSNNVLILTYPVFQYFKINRTVKLNGVKIKRSAMIMEKYLRLGYYSKPPIELKRRLQKTAALSYMTTGQAHLLLIQKYIPILKEKGWCVDGLKNQEEVLYKRFDYQTMFSLYENYPPLELDKENGELDLYNLECNNSFISGIRFAGEGERQLIVYADIYNVYEKSPLSIAKLVLQTQETLEAIFADYKNDNFAKVYVQIYSHLAYSADYEKKVYTYLCAQPEYIGNEALAKDMVQLNFLNTKTTLFSNIDPCSIV